MINLTIIFAFGIVILFSYLLGSISSAILVSRIYAKDDVRRHGSGSAGMTNILRTYGGGPATITLAGDVLKGVVAVLLSRLVFYLFHIEWVDAGYISGLFVLLGHLFPVYFHFKGGKGVATALGIILVINPVIFLALVILFVPLVIATKYVSLGSILGAVSFPVFTWLFHFLRGEPFLYDTLCAAVIGAIVLVMHRQNIKRLLTGTENKFTRKK